MNHLETIITDWFVFWRPTINTFFGAGLGAAFYILLNTQTYLVTRSYDPKFNAVYAARFVTGMIGGMILANALAPIVQGAMKSGDAPSLTPGVLAILGGYAAEAVQQILQRIVEIMLAAVRGDGSAQAQAKATALLVSNNAAVRNLLLDAAKETDPDKKKQILNKVDQLLKKTDLT